LYKAQEVGGRVRPGSRDKILQPLSKKGLFIYEVLLEVYFDSHN